MQYEFLISQKNKDRYQMGLGSNCCRYYFKYDFCLFRWCRIVLDKNRCTITVNRFFSEFKCPSLDSTVSILKNSRGIQLSFFIIFMKTSWGICTLPRSRAFAFPFFCFSRSFIFRVISPPYK